MAQIDDRMRAEIAPHLWQGEQVLFTAGIFRPAHQQDVFAIASTPFRSFIFECSATFMTGAPDAPRDGGKRVVVEHAHLSDFIAPNVGLLGDQVLRFSRPNTEVVAYQISSTMAALGSQGEYIHTFVPWLQRHVLAGTFRTPEGMQYIAGEAQDINAMRAVAQQQGEAARQQRAAEAKVKADKAGVRWPIGLAVPLFLVAAVMAQGTNRANMLAEDYAETAGRQQKLYDDAVAKSKDGDDTPKAKKDDPLAATSKKADDPVAYQLANGKKNIAESKRKQKDKEGDIIVFGAATGAAVLAGIGMIVLSVVLTKKKHARLAAPVA